MFEKGSLQNHTYHLSRAISLEVSESFNKVKYAFFFLHYSNNAYIFILFLLSVFMPSYISALVFPTVYSPVSFILSFCSSLSLSIISTL